MATLLSSLATLLLALPQSDSPVADAAMRGDADRVRELLRAGADANAAQGDGMSARHWASRRGEKELVEMLLFAGARTGANTRIGSYTPLHLACQAGHADVVRALVAAGAELERSNDHGTRALHLAAAAGDAETVATLLELGAEVDALEQRHGQTALMFAAARDRAEVLALLVDAGADTATSSRVVDVPARADEDSKMRRQRSRIVAASRAPTERKPEPAPKPMAADKKAEAKTAKKDAAASEKKKAAEETAEPPPDGDQELGTPVDAQEPPPRDDGTNPGSEPVARAGRSSDPTAELQSREGDRKDDDEAELSGPELPRMNYAALVHKTGGMTALHHACRQGHGASALRLLELGADINQVSGDGSSPLLIAVINGHFDLAMELLARGAEPERASHAGATPLYAAVQLQWAPHAFYPQPSARQEQTSHLELMRALLQAGADPNRRLKHKLWYSGYNFDQAGVHEMGSTAFWRAAQSSDVEAMRLLVEFGADTQIWSVVPPGGRRAPFDFKVPGKGRTPQKVPPGGRATSALHVASGAGFDGNFHRNAPGGWLPAVRYLVDELGFDVNEPDHMGYTALHNAAFRGDNEMILFLVERGADVTAVADTGQTVLDMANGPIQRLQPYTDTIELLQGMGALNNHWAVSK